MGNNPRRSFNTVKQSNRTQRAKRQRMEAIALLSICAVIILIILTLLVWGGFAVANAISGGGSDTGTTPPPSTGDGPQSDAQLSYVQKTTASANVHEGELIVVNEKNSLAYIFPTSLDLLLMNDIRIAQNGVNPYQTQYLRSDEKLQSAAAHAVNRMLTDFYLKYEDTSLILMDTHRTQEEQERYSTPVGYSEHHTGYVFTIKTYNNVGKAVPLMQNVAGQWIYDNCHKYGIICRYPESKSDATGVGGYDYCFRYVGVAHATYMYQNNLCLEEYVSLLRGGYSPEAPLSFTGADGNAYLVYYVKAADTEITTLRVPKDYAYTVSGDNSQGFIVTANLSQPNA